MFRIRPHILITFIFGLISFVSTGQSILPIRLNKHYYEISEQDSANHVFNKLVSYASDSTKIERIFNLTNQLKRIIRTSPKIDDYQELTVEEFSESGKLQHKTTANLVNSKFITSYFNEREQVAQVMYRGEHKYTIYRKGYAKPKETLENDFEPNPNEANGDFNFFISQRTKFSRMEWPSIRQLVVIGLHVNELGEVTEVIWVNPLGAEKRVAEKYLKAFRAWKKGFYPAKDVNGNPVSNWKYYHFSPGGRLENPQVIIKIK